MSELLITRDLPFSFGVKIMQIADAASVPETELPTVIYIHGIGNKPSAPILKTQWDRALFGIDMGARTRMAYWADLRYPQPSAGASAETVGATAVGSLSLELQDESFLGMLAPQSDEARIFVQNLGLKMLSGAGQRPEYAGRVQAAAEMDARILPGFLQRPVTEWITKLFLKDVAAYFYASEEKEAMRTRFRNVLLPQKQPYVVVAHSLGSVIAYDVLKTLEPRSGVNVALLLTIGSPLGIAEVQQNIVHPRQRPESTACWFNFFDRLDPVALDQQLKPDYDPNAPNDIFYDQTVINLDSLRLAGFNPHSSIGYLSTGDVHTAVRSLLGISFASPVSKFIIARDLAANLADSNIRHPVLIEIQPEMKGITLEEKVGKLADTIGEITQGNPNARIDRLRRYVAALLTAPEAYQLANLCKEAHIETIWRNSAKSALLNVSSRVIQAYTAQLGYGATGDKITWAVLDTGVSAHHPHFCVNNNILGQWNCTAVGSPIQVPPTDLNGHGTHVAGIIAGGGTAPPNEDFRGIAPKSKIWMYQVLDESGQGNDAWIIKALDHIASVNEASPDLVIHGVNLSLGGSFDATVFGCGFSPICNELRRLWRMGVLVCVAAGNEGRLAVETVDGEQQLNLDLSIGDPANLEECIAVGAVNKDQPHMYGISYFSSRGPTADGRAKPDVVAPGEHIYSCNARFSAAQPNSYYIPMSGTSMACPHVSGLLAGFLSVHQEFVGHPDQIKDVLLKNCTDLRRNIYHQGAGIPNLVRMLMNT